MKRLLDFAFATLGLILMAPFFLVIMIGIRLTSRGPALYRARRTGLNGKPFDLLKFRSMVVTDGSGAAITRAGDPRVTPLGRFLRATKIDELPQLVNVVRGEMSLVGPRPEDPRYTALYDEKQRAILAVRPGITSAASLSYRDEESRLTGDDWERTYVERIMPEKLRIDLEYIRHRTLLSDAKLMLKTLSVVLPKRRGATTNGSVN